MQDPAAATPVFQAALLSLLEAGATLRNDLGAAQAAWFDASHVAFVYDVARCDVPSLVEMIEKVWKLPGVDLVDVVLAGGDRAVFQSALDTRPAYTGQRALGLVWVTDEGAIEADRASKRAVEVLRNTFQQGVPVMRTEAEAEAVMVDAARRGSALAAELADFQRRISRRTAVMTRGLLVVMVVFFVVKLALGEHGLATDVRMGALVPGRVASAPWRLLSHAFLHASLWHILFNGLSLFSLGTFFEGLLGRSRFTALFMLSAIGGGLAAALASPRHVMVGASGAVWGMLGVSFALALRPGETLPTAFQEGFRRNAVSNLVIQVMVSMIPNVSWQAHLGGGLVGFALMLSGALRPHRDDLANRLWKPLGAGLLILCATALVAAFADGRPWMLLAPPALTPYALPGTAVTVSLPGAPTREGPADRFEFASGDALSDGFGLGVQASTLTESITADQLRVSADELRVSLGTLAHPPRSTETGPLRVVTLGGFPALAQDFSLSNDQVFEHRLALRPNATVSVQLVHWRDDARVRDLADRIATSVIAR